MEKPINSTATIPVYIVANDVVLPELVRLLASVRIHAPRAELRLVPFNDDFDLAGPIGELYGCGIVKNDLEEYDAFGREIFDDAPPQQPYPYMLGKMRKLAMLTHPGPAIYIDVDTIFVSPLVEIVGNGPDTNFDLGFVSISKGWIYEDVQDAQMLLRRTHGFSTSFLFKKTDNLTFETVKHTVRSHLDLYRKVRRQGLIDQPLFNFVADMTNLQVRRLESIFGVSGHSVATSDSVSFKVRLTPEGHVIQDWQNVERQVLFLHKPGKYKHHDEYDYLFSSALYEGLVHIYRQDKALGLATLEAIDRWRPATIFGKEGGLELTREQPGIDGLVAAARGAQHSGDWDAAIRRWEEVRSRWPDAVDGYIGGASALRESGRLDEADGLLGEASRRFANDRDIAIDHAWLANARRDWAAAIRRWEDVRSRWPEIPDGYRGGASALRERGRLDDAERLLREASGRFVDDREIVVARAWLANARRDWTMAIGQWEAVRRHWPAITDGYRGGAGALRASDRLDEAEALLGEASRRFGDDREIATAHAWLANARRDWLAAIGRWENVRARWPEFADGYRGGASALRESGRLEEAEALLGEASRRFVDNREIAVAHAWSANAGRDPAAAVGRWEAVRLRWPEIADGYRGGAGALRASGRLDEAEALLDDALRRFANDREIAVAHAWLANTRRDWVAAIDRWDAVRSRWPEITDGYRGGAGALREIGRLDEAEELLGEALRRFADDREIAVGHAWLANARHDWAAAIDRWETVRSRWPDVADGYRGGAAALRESGRLDEAEGLLERLDRC